MKDEGEVLAQLIKFKIWRPNDVTLRRVTTNAIWAVSLTELYGSQVALQSFILNLKRAPQKTPAWEARSQVARKKILALAP